jgi:hypothetical protein
VISILKTTGDSRLAGAILRRRESARRRVWGSTWAEDAVWELPHLDMEGLRGAKPLLLRGLRP